MKSRKEVVNYIKIYWGFDHEAIPNTPKAWLDNEDGTKYAWHYGKVDLRHLLDFIYGGPPKHKEDELTWSKTPNPS